MVTSKAATVPEYLASLAPERREAIERVRQVVNEHLPAGFEETMQHGMISWVVPLSRFRDTYNGQALAIASLASQKAHASLYLMGVYADARARAAFERAFRAAGKKLDMGKSCVRFRSADDLALDAVGEAIAGISVDDFLASYATAKQAKKTR